MESSVTPDPDFLSEWSVTGRIKYAFTDSLLGEFSYVRNEFDRTGVNEEQIMLEKVFGPFQLAYRLGFAQVLSGAGDSSNHRIEAKFYYKHGSNVGFQYFFGDIVQDEPDGVFRDDINAWIVDGKHLFSPHWGITYGTVIWDQDDRYTRISGKLGVRYEF